MKDGKLRKTFVKQISEKKITSIVMLQKAEEEKSARVAERCSMCFVPEKNGPEKNRPKVRRGIKNAAKVTKKRRLMIFSFVKSLNKKKREKNRERERERNSTWHPRETGPLEPVHTCHIERLTLPQGW